LDVNLGGVHSEPTLAQQRRTWGTRVLQYTGNFHRDEINCACGVARPLCFSFRIASKYTTTCIAIAPLVSMTME
jgi:hypothetical protein